MYSYCAWYQHTVDYVDLWTAYLINLHSVSDSEKNGFSFSFVIVLLFILCCRSLAYNICFMFFFLDLTGEAFRSFSRFTSPREERAHLHLQLYDFPAPYQWSKTSNEEVDWRTTCSAMVQNKKIKWPACFQLGFKQNCWTGVFHVLCMLEVKIILYSYCSRLGCLVAPISWSKLQPCYAQDMELVLLSQKQRRHRISSG